MCPAADTIAEHPVWISLYTDRVDRLRVGCAAHPKFFYQHKKGKEGGCLKGGKKRTKNILKSSEVEYNTVARPKSI